MFDDLNVVLIESFVVDDEGVFEYVVLVKLSFGWGGMGIKVCMV